MTAKGDQGFHFVGRARRYPVNEAGRKCSPLSHRIWSTNKMKNLFPILLFSIALASCKSPEEQAWKSIDDSAKIKKLLDAGLSANLEGGTAPKLFLLQSATEMHRVDTVKVLLDHGADPDKKTWGTEKTCLFLAAYGDNLKIAQALIDAKADPNATDMFGNNALREAIVTKRVKMIELLLRNGADPQLRNKEGDTMLDLAKKYGTPEIVSLMEKSVGQPASSDGEKSAN